MATRTIFGAGKQASPNDRNPSGPISVFGHFRNRQPAGTPIPFGERPTDRPMADQLGNGRNYAARNDRAKAGFGGTSFKETPPLGPMLGMARPSDPAHFRKATGLRLFSWEQSDANG